MRKAKRCELFFRKIWRSPVPLSFPLKGTAKTCNFVARSGDLFGKFVMIHDGRCILFLFLYRYLGLQNHSHTIHGMIVYLPTWMTRSQRPLKWSPPILDDLNSLLKKNLWGKLWSTWTFQGIDVYGLLPPQMAKFEGHDIRLSFWLVQKAHLGCISKSVIR